MISAGDSQYRVADLELLSQDTHKFESRNLDQLIGPYPAEKQVYVERSPIHALDKFTAPTAFFQVSWVVQAQSNVNLPCTIFNIQVYFIDTGSSRVSVGCAAAIVQSQAHCACQCWSCQHPALYSLTPGQCCINQQCPSQLSTKEGEGRGSGSAYQSFVLICESKCGRNPTEFHKCCTIMVDMSVQSIIMSSQMQKSNIGLLCRARRIKWCLPTKLQKCTRPSRSRV